MKVITLGDSQLTHTLCFPCHFSFVSSLDLFVFAKVGKTSITRCFTQNRFQDTHRPSKGYVLFNCIFLQSLWGGATNVVSLRYRLSS